MPESFHCKLDIRASQIGVGHTGVQPQGPVRIGARHRSKAAHVADVELLCLPGLETLRDLFWKALRVCRSPEGLSGQDARSLMMPMSVPLSTGKTRHQHIGTER